MERGVNSHLVVPEMYRLFGIQHLVVKVEIRAATRFIVRVAIDVFSLEHQIILESVFVSDGCFIVLLPVGDCVKELDT